MWSADAGFYDIASGGTGRLKGFRSGCRNSLIPANCVLNAPNMVHDCSCSYSIFTSLGLVHVPEEVGGSRRAVVRELPGIRADRAISIIFTPERGRAMISGVEIIREKD